MCIEGQESWIFRGCNRTRWSKDRKEKNSRSSRLASVKEYEECAKVSGVGKLL